MDRRGFLAFLVGGVTATVIGTDAEASPLADLSTSPVEPAELLSPDLDSMEVDYARKGGGHGRGRGHHGRGRHRGWGRRRGWGRWYGRRRRRGWARRWRRGRRRCWCY